MMQRGDIVVCVVSGDYGKPRPAVIIQSDLFNATHASICICPITSHIIEAPLFRILLTPSPQNGLQQVSQIMVDKMLATQRDKISRKIGTLTVEQLKDLQRALKTWLDLID